MLLTDTHVHLHFPDFDEERGEIYRRARESGVGLFINVGTDLETSRAAIQIAEEYPDVYATAGVHPHDAKEADASVLAEIERLIEHPRVCAVGEVGLDFFRDHSPHDIQADVLRFFIRLHQRIGKPLIIHCRDAYDRFLQVLAGEEKQNFSGVMHCFSADAGTMKKCLDYGFYISFAGPLTYKKNDMLREACRHCPPDRMLIETDAPFLPPQSRRGKRNEPAYMLETAEKAAEIHGLSLPELAEITTANARRLFSI